ncbi:MAG: RNA degradosome polyphosphate kinase, partial [Pseudomonadota bacterium]
MSQNPPEMELQPADLFLNRELSLLEFNRRVLEQAKDESVPLLERLKFLCIASSNLDEFFEIRVAGLQQMVELNPNQRLPDGILPHEMLG